MIADEVLQRGEPHRPPDVVAVTDAADLEVMDAPASPEKGQDEVSHLGVALPYQVGSRLPDLLQSSAGQGSRDSAVEPSVENTTTMMSWACDITVYRRLLYN